jgi:hypothetical protein
MASLVHTEEVAGSIPASPTLCFCWSDGLSMIFIGGPFLILGSKWGARPADLTRSPKCSGRFPWYSYVSAASRVAVLLPMIAAGRIRWSPMFDWTAWADVRTAG